MGTSYRPISILSVVARTMEKFLVPFITANITQTPTHGGSKGQHATVTALHTLNNIIAKGFNQMALSVELDMSKAVDTVNTHTPIGTSIKFIANYFKGRKAYTTFKNHKSL